MSKGKNNPIGLFFSISMGVIAMIEVYVCFLISGLGDSVIWPIVTVIGILLSVVSCTISIIQALHGAIKHCAKGKSGHRMKGAVHSTLIVSIVVLPIYIIVLKAAIIALNPENRTKNEEQQIENPVAELAGGPKDGSYEDLVADRISDFEDMVQNVGEGIRFPLSINDEYVPSPSCYEELDALLRAHSVADLPDLSSASSEALNADADYSDKTQEADTHYVSIYTARVDNAPFAKIKDLYMRAIGLRVEATLIAQEKYGGFRYENMFLTGRYYSELGALCREFGYHDEAIEYLTRALGYLFLAIRQCELYGWENSYNDYQIPLVMAKTYNELSILTSSDSARYIESLIVADYWAERQSRIETTTHHALEVRLIRVEINNKLAERYDLRETKGYYIRVSESLLADSLQYQRQLSDFDNRRLFIIRRQELFDLIARFYIDYPSGYNGLISLSDYKTKYNILD
jgi:hypothetical protein